MKKLTSLTLTLVLILSLFTACGGSAKSEAAAPMDYAVMEEEAMEARLSPQGERRKYCCDVQFLRLGKIAVYRENRGLHRSWTAD